MERPNGQCESGAKASQRDEFRHERGTLDTTPSPIIHFACWLPLGTSSFSELPIS